MAPHRTVARTPSRAVCDDVVASVVVHVVHEEHFVRWHVVVSRRSPRSVGQLPCAMQLDHLGKGVLAVVLVAAGRMAVLRCMTVP